MGEKSLHAVGRGIFQMEEAKTMGPDDVYDSRHSMPMGEVKIAFIIAQKEIM